MLILSTQEVGWKGQRAASGGSSSLCSHPCTSAVGEHTPSFWGWCGLALHSCSRMKLGGRVNQSCLNQSLSWGCSDRVACTQPFLMALPSTTAKPGWFGSRCTFPAPGCLRLFRRGVCSRVFAHTSTASHNVQASRMQAAALWCKHNLCFPPFLPLTRPQRFSWDCWVGMKPS